jgi:hypothetical protein
MILATVAHSVPVIVRGMPPEVVKSLPHDSLTDWITAISTVFLVFGALLGGLLANKQLNEFRKAELLKNTFYEVRAYSQPSGELPSPVVAFASLDDMEPNPWVVAERYKDKRQEMTAFIRSVTIPYTILSNYLDEADDFIERKVIDSDVFLSRQYAVILETVTLLRRFKDIVPARAYKPAMLGRIEDKAQRFKERTGVAEDCRPEDDKTSYEPPPEHGSTTGNHAN